MNVLLRNIFSSLVSVHFEFSSWELSARDFSNYFKPSISGIGKCHEHNSGQSPIMLVDPGVKKRVQQVAIDYCSVTCCQNLF